VDKQADFSVVASSAPSTEVDVVAAAGAPTLGCPSELRTVICCRPTLGEADALPALHRSLRASDPNERLFAGRLAGTLPEPRTSEDLWPPVNFHDDRYYPHDALMRHQATASLPWIVLAVHRPPPRQPTVTATALAAGEGLGSATRH
jgi:hypothetical protein